MKYTIYKITNKLDNKIYIGKHQTTNINDYYFGSGKYLKHAIDKHGIENFKKEILYVFETEEEMNQKEKEIVTEEFVNRKDTYNICIGGDGGFSYINKNFWTKEKKLEHNKKAWAIGRQKVTKDELREYGRKGGLKTTALYGSPNADGSSFRGWKHSEESKRNIGKKNSIHQQGQNNSQYGTMWITNGTENKKVKKDTIIPSGWYKGRTI